MLKTKKKAGKSGTLSQGTVKRRAAVLSAMLSQAVRWNILERNPMDSVQIKKPAPKEEKIQCFTQEQAEIFLSILDKPLVYEYGTQSRRDSSGKICKSVCRVKGKNIVKTPKNPKTCRVMAVPAVVMDVARLWKREQATYRLFTGS